MADGDPARVDFDELDVAPEGAQYLYGGKPFTGVAYEMHPNGDMVGETEYRNGFPYGLSREWYGPGQPREEMTFGGEGLHGPARAWYPDGRPKSEEVYEYGIRVAAKEWDPSGGVMRDWHLSETDADYARLQERRRRHLETGPSA